MSCCVFLISPQPLPLENFRSGYNIGIGEVRVKNFGEKRADWQLAAHDPRQEKWANLQQFSEVLVALTPKEWRAHGLSTPNTQAAFLHSLTAQYLIPPSSGLCERRQAQSAACVVQHTVQNISGLDLRLSVIYCATRSSLF